ncbi:MAG: N-acetylmuramoyl-L-alanine amidase [Acetivibrionales bacterium]|jgi:N-acetylmuramoyl-L-alanine amidase
MKKFLASILAVILFVSFANSVSYANGKAAAGGLPGELKEIRYEKEGFREIVYVKVSGYSEYSCMELSDPFRIVIDLRNVAVPKGMGILQAGGKVVERVRYAQFTKTTARVVLDVKEGYDYTIVSADEGLIVYVEQKPEKSEKPDPQNAIIFTGDFWIKCMPAKLDETGEEAEKVSLSLVRHEGYRVSRLTDPERLVITIPDAGIISTPKQADIDGSQVKSISYKKAGKSGAEITIETKAQYQYAFSKNGNELVMTLRRPSFRNITYHNNGDRVYFELEGAKLTEGDRDLKPLYTEGCDDSGKIYSIAFPSCQADLGEGVLDINDSFLKSIEVRNDKETETTMLVLTGTSKNSYLVYTRESGTTAITVLKPDTGKKTVVIDPGHGGTAIGAKYGEIEEKNLNFDIAKRLEELLRKEGVTTYLLRNDDSNIDNYERAYIANKLNAALYLSIHINATNKKSTKGTMTLYCPSSAKGFVGKDFAEIVQKNLLSALKTENKNTRSRPDLIVLRETTMPAALAEIAFLTNSSDRANLMKESFRQKAAQALCASVIEALERVS